MSEKKVPIPQVSEANQVELKSEEIAGGEVVKVSMAGPSPDEKA